MGPGSLGLVYSRTSQEKAPEPPPLVCQVKDEEKKVKRTLLVGVSEDDEDDEDEAHGISLEKFSFKME